jgi:hypothetical protein
VIKHATQIRATVDLTEPDRFVSSARWCGALPPSPT